MKELVLLLSGLMLFLVFISFLHARAMRDLEDDWNYTMWDVLDPRVNTSGKTWRERSKRPDLFATSICLMMISLRFSSPVIALAGSSLLLFTTTSYAKHPLESFRGLSKS